MQILLGLITIIAYSFTANASCGCEKDEWQSLVKTREMVFTAVAISQDRTQATFELKKTYRGLPPKKIQMPEAKEEWETGTSGILVGETYMFAISKEQIVKSGEPTVLALGCCDGPRDEKNYKLEAKFLKSFNFKPRKKK